MSDLYNRIEDLCKTHGINITEMCRRAGVSRGNLTDLKSGRQSGLSAKNMDKVASYFGVTIGYLLGTEKEKAPATEGERDTEMEEILQDFRDNPALRTLFSLSRSATPEDLRQYADVIRALRGSKNE